MMTLEEYNRGKSFEISESGVVAKRVFRKGEILGPAYLSNADNTSWTKSLLTNYIGHSTEPNIQLKKESNRIFIFETLMPISTDIELLIDHATYPWYEA